MPELQETGIRCQVLCECKEFQGLGLYLHTYFFTGEDMKKTKIIKFAEATANHGTHANGEDHGSTDQAFRSWYALHFHPDRSDHGRRFRLLRFRRRRGEDRKSVV